ncbi:hypothetical protein [Arthrobacter sp. SLBN-112]|uniref:hypothetical protein n=1 Tax=Arthrobacter sp. SLBN-112 TaxID=2768452 RepID=UPI0027B217E0|nr:hypothetical protein [Arthrobacter sp. SLBN-112]MDQ0799024.1 ABC-type sugar transport system substrate-binding protein [Arthrobacter sp. SLBN-112]
MSRITSTTRVSASVAAVTLMAALAACSPPPLPTQSSGNGANADASGENYLVAPSSAVKVKSEEGTPVTSPDGKQFTMPYSNIAPLPDGPVGDPAKTYTVCFSQADSIGSWAVAQRESAAIEAARHPNVKVLYYNTNNDPLKQVQDLDFLPCPEGRCCCGLASLR